MNHKINISKLLKQLVREQNPDRLQRDRMKEKVFAELNIEAPIKTHTNIIDLINMNKKLLLGTATIAIIGIFVGLPLFFSAQKLGLESTTYLSGEGDARSVGNASEPAALNDSTAGMTATESIAKQIVDYMPNIMPEAEVQEEDTNTKENDRAKQKTGNLYLLVENVGSSIDQIYELTSSVEGYVVDSYFSAKTNSGTGMITIGVPSDKFDFTMKSLHNLAIEVKSENTNILDLQNEITNNANDQISLREELAAKYTELKTATETRKPILENEIKQLENAIKILEDQAEQLDQKASFSTISIDLHQKTGEEATEGLADILSVAWEKAQTILMFWAKAGIWVTLILPALALPAILFVLARKVMKKLTKK